MTEQIEIEAEKVANDDTLTTEEKNHFKQWFGMVHGLLVGLFPPGSGEITQLSQITPDSGTLYKGEIIAAGDPPAELDPTNANFTGSFMSGLGRTFNSVVYNFGSVASGVLGWGANNLGQWMAGAGAIFADATGFFVHVTNDLFRITGTYMMVGSNIAAPETTFFVIFFSAQTYNGESMEAGSILFGCNTTGYGNLLWKPSEKSFYWRGGTTVQVTINTLGQVLAGAGAVVLDATGITINQGSATENKIKFNDGSGNIITAIYADNSGGYDGFSLISQDSQPVVSTFGALRTLTQGVYLKLVTSSHKVEISKNGTPGSSVDLSVEGNITAANFSGSSSGTNTGDETAARIAAINHGATEKTSLVDADEITGQDSAASWGLIRTTWTNVKAFLKTYFDTLYVPKTRTLTGSAPITIESDHLSHDLSANRTIGIVAATTSVAGSMSSADKTKLDSIASGAQVNVLEGVTGTAPIVAGAISSKSQAISINAATTSAAGSMSATDKQNADTVVSALFSTSAATYTIGVGEMYVTGNRASTITFTLPDPTVARNPIWFRNINTGTMVSASSNVVPLAGGAAGTAILAGTAGKWAMLVSNGTNWVIMAAN